MSDHKLRIKRVYEPVDDNDGQRVLVDGIWPRGMTRQAAALDLWLRDIAPSAASGDSRVIAAWTRRDGRSSSTAIAPRSRRTRQRSRNCSRC